MDLSSGIGEQIAGQLCEAARRSPLWPWAARRARLAVSRQRLSLGGSGFLKLMRGDTWIGAAALASK